MFFVVLISFVLMGAIYFLMARSVFRRLRLRGAEVIGWVNEGNSGVQALLQRGSYVLMILLFLTLTL